MIIWKTKAMCLDLEEEIAAWATKHGYTCTALNEMLDILMRHGHCLPKDAQTLLQTPTSVQSVVKCGGQYIYLGLQ